MDANFSIHAMHFLEGYLSFSFQISMMYFPQVNKMGFFLGGGRGLGFLMPLSTIFQLYCCHKKWFGKCKIKYTRIILTKISGVWESYKRKYVLKKKIK